MSEPKVINPKETLYWMMKLIVNGYSPREARYAVDDAVKQYEEDNR